MDKVSLIERLIIKPEKPTQHRRIFLSNIDLVLLSYQESVSFFDPPKVTFDEACEKLHKALQRLFVHYDFFVGRLAPSSEDNQRLEIDCNGAGVVFVAAKTETTLAQLGDLVAPKPEFRQFIAFLHEDNEEQLEIQDMPLLFVQLTQLGCGNIAFASRYNHCVLDGASVREFQANMAALTRDREMVIAPISDRTMFKARDPPVINHPHHEYSKPTETDYSLTFRSNITANFDQFSFYGRTHLVYLSPLHIAAIKNSALKDGELHGCSVFQAVAAKIWKARTIAMNMKENKITTMFFPVDVRKRVVPAVPAGFSGNAIIPGFAELDVKEMKEVKEHVVVKKVQEGIERLNDEYVRSSIDWLEVHKGVPWREDCFSLVAWSGLGLEEDEFVWGKVRSSAPVSLKPGLVYLLPGSKDGGLNICFELDDDQFKEFERLMMEI